MNVTLQQLSFTGGEWTPSLDARTDLQKYNSAVRRMYNFFPHPHGGASNRGGLHYLAKLKYQSKKPKLVPFQFNTVQTYMLIFEDTVIRVLKDGGLVTLTGSVTGAANNGSGLIRITQTAHGYSTGWEVTISGVTGTTEANGTWTITKIDADHYDLQASAFVHTYGSGGSAAGVIEIVVPYVEADLPKVKYRQSADTLYLTHPTYPPATLTRSSHTVWTYSAITFAASVNPPTSVTASSGVAYQYAVTAVSEAEEESVISNQVAGDRTATLFWTAPVSGTAPAYYNIYEQKGGVWGLVTRTAGAGLSQMLPNAAPDMTVGPPQHDNPFSGAGDYPGCSGFFEQRAMWGRTNNQPQNVKGSRTGFFTNMDVSVPIRDDDAIDFNLPSEGVNEIMWMIALEDLIIGTAGAEWKLGVGSQDGILSPTSVTLRRQSFYGCCDIPPKIAGDSVLFIDGSRKRVRNLAYSLEKDKYVGEDLAIWGQHLFAETLFSDWDYQRYPDSILWGVLESGALVGLTYLKEQNVAGWHQHATDGTFEAVAVLPGRNGVYDEVYLATKRSVNGQVVRYIEVMDNRDFTDVEDAFFVDCGLTYDGAATNVISGLEHLEGKTVSVLGDGNVFSNLVVTDGSITLPEGIEVSKAHVGLPYICQLQTLSFDMDTRMGTIQNKIRIINSVSLKLYRTRSAFAGPSFTKLKEIPFRSTENYGDPVELFSGIKDLSILPADLKKDGSVCIQVHEPVPITVNGIMVEMSIGESSR